MSQLTQKAIVSSIKKLLNEKPLNRITIKDITDDCGVNRMTFYYHFRDIYDLVEWMCKEDAERIKAQHKEDGNWEELLISFFNELRDNKIFFLNIYRCISREEIEKFLHMVIDEMVMDVINTYPESRYIREEDKKFIARIYSYSFAGIMLDWIKNNMEDDPKALVTNLSLVISDSIQKAIVRFKRI